MSLNPRLIDRGAFCTSGAPRPVGRPCAEADPPAPDLAQVVRDIPGICAIIPENRAPIYAHFSFRTDPRLIICRISKFLCCFLCASTDLLPRSRAGWSSSSRQASTSRLLAIRYSYKNGRNCNPALSCRVYEVAAFPQTENHAGDSSMLRRHFCPRKRTKDKKRRERARALPPENLSAHRTWPQPCTMYL